MGAALLLALALCGDVRDTRMPVVEDRVDNIHENHFFDDDGRHVLDQQIYSDWCDEAERHQVRAWRLMRYVNQRVVRDYKRGGYISIWVDGERLRVIRAHSFTESWSQYDPELLERSVLPIDQRKDLSR